MDDFIMNFVSRFGMGMTPTQVVVSIILIGTLIVVILIARKQRYKNPNDWKGPYD